MASYYHARVHEERPMLTAKLLQTTQKKTFRVKMSRLQEMAKFGDHATDF